MNLSKQDREELRDFILRMCPSNQGYVEREAFHCLEDLGEKDKEIEVLEQNLAAAEETIVHKDNRIAELEGLLHKSTNLAVYTAWRKIEKLQARLKAYDGLDSHYGIDDD